MKLAALAALALLLVPLAAAQMAATPVRDGSVIIDPRGHGFSLDLRPDTAGEAHFATPFLVSGVDNRVNLTVRNFGPSWWNATFTVNATNAEVHGAPLQVVAPPGKVTGVVFTVRPQEIGSLTLVASSPDGYLPSGELAQVTWEAVAVPAVSLTFLDPPPVGEDDDEYVAMGPFGSGRMFTHSVTVRPGEPVTPRMEARNPLDVALPGFTVELRGEEGLIGRVEVDGLDPGERRTLEFPAYVSAREYYGGGFGPRGTFRLDATVTFSLGSVSATVSPASFEIRNGAVANLVPLSAGVILQDGVSVELLVPKKVTLGVPTRVLINVTNHGLAPSTGRVVARVETPSGLDYGVQAPEVRVVDVSLPPGGAKQEAIEITPRVTGTWTVTASFDTGDGGRYGFGGGGFTVPGPVSIRIPSQQVVYARLNEPVRVELEIATEETLPGATLQIAARSPQGGGFGDEAATSGSVRPGLSQRLVRTTTGTGDLGELRPGGVTTASVEVVSGASGRYTVVPFVLSEGFAYTHTGEDPPPGAIGGEIHYPGSYSGSRGAFDVAVQPRFVSPAWALAPLALGTAFFVGMWTMRTRYVK